MFMISFMNINRVTGIQLSSVIGLFLSTVTIHALYRNKIKWISLSVWCLGNILMMSFAQLLALINSADSSYDNFFMLLDLYDKPSIFVLLSFLLFSIIVIIYILQNGKTVHLVNILSYIFTVLYSIVIIGYICNVPLLYGHIDGVSQGVSIPTSIYFIIFSYVMRGIKYCQE